MRRHGWQLPLHPLQIEPLLPFPLVDKDDAVSPAMKTSRSASLVTLRGDTAYCSLECWQQQMNIDEKKKKC
ncbi:hypothetical protein EJ110_NYTH08096 [Nymphaea thermarum]|nr:hypothetical protein EJ110_NYTH08096 [Nymphaea thermarum]